MGIARREGCTEGHSRGYEWSLCAFHTKINEVMWEEDRVPIRIDRAARLRSEQKNATSTHLFSFRTERGKDRPGLFQSNPPLPVVSASQGDLVQHGPRVCGLGAAESTKGFLKNAARLLYHCIPLTFGLYQRTPCMLGSGAHRAGSKRHQTGSSRRRPVAGGQGRGQRRGITGNSSAGSIIKGSFFYCSRVFFAVWMVNSSFSCLFEMALMYR